MSQTTATNNGLAEGQSGPPLSHGLDCPETQWQSAKCRRGKRLSVCHVDIEQEGTILTLSRCPPGWRVQPAQNQTHTPISLYTTRSHTQPTPSNHGQVWGVQGHAYKTAQQASSMQSSPHPTTMIGLVSQWLHHLAHSHGHNAVQAGLYDLVRLGAQKQSGHHHVGSLATSHLGALYCHGKAWRSLVGPSKRPCVTLAGSITITINLRGHHRWASM